MKTFRQIISVILCVLVACSAFAIGANAAAKKKTTPKKYVKSISIAKKATITIPYNKKTLAKNYKVTVKVKGKVSKKFTVKSSKTAVATAKVSGTKVKITAKKAGTTKIKVTTKAKSVKGKKLSKTLTLTVKKAKKVIPATIYGDSYDTELKLSDYVDNTKVNAEKVYNMISNPKSNGAYYAEVVDSSVAATKSKGTIIYPVAEGTTQADILEDIGGKKRLLGIINITVSKVDMARTAEDIILDYGSGLNDTWLKLDFGKDKFDLGAVYRDLLNNESYGTMFKDTDYNMSFSSDKENVATVDSNGVVTGVKNGEVQIETKMTFTDNSEYEEYTIITVTGNAIEKVEGYSIDNIRDKIVGLDTPVELADGTKQPMINFDNAATTPAFKAVQDAVNEELEMYGSIGRGFSQKSNHSTDVYNSTRDKVLQFLGADPEFYTCFYVNTTTDGLNKLASALVESPDDVVLTTRIEHHANDLSWRERCKVIYAEVDEKGRVIYDDIEKLLKKNKVKIVSVSAASNVTGYVNDVHRVAKMAHKYGAKIVVDGAQIVAHRKFSMLGNLDDQNDDIDFIAFSAHKMYSPYGGGAVVGVTEELNKHMPTFYGGGTIRVVGDNWQVYKEAPAAYEAGSPNYPGVVGLGKAIDVLSTIGMDNIQAHEKVLNRKIIDGLKTLPNVILYGDSENIDDRVGVVTFNFSDINTFFISEQLSLIGGVATRRGAFCAHPYVWRLMGISDEKARSFENCSDVNTAGMVRVSFGIYNNEDDVDKFLDLMPTVMAKAMEAQKASTAEPAY